jgi:hypothetical protein
LIIDKLVLSPGIDIDNLEIVLLANMESMAKRIETLKKKPLDYLISKAYLRKGEPGSNSLLS